MIDGTINIAVIGKTGVGKSSFCNYIFQNEVFKTGTGSPVTGWDQHFKSHGVSYENFTLNVYDSVGIEADNLREWRSHLHEFLDKRKPDYRVNPSDWIHSAIYVVNAASARIEAKELELIKIIKSSRTPVQVVLTNSDQATEIQISTIRTAITEEIGGVDFSEVCSVSVKKRSGASSEPYGREEFLTQLLRKMDSTLRQQLVESMCQAMQLSLVDTKQAMISLVKDSDIGLFNIIKKSIKDGDSFDLDDLMNGDMNATLDGVASSYEEAIEAIDRFSEMFSYYSDRENTTFDVVLSIKDSVEMAMNEASSKIEDYFDSVTNDLDSGTVWEKFKAVGVIAKVLVSLKSFMIKQISLAIDAGIVELNAQKLKLENGI